jgi:hypothetical protein
MTVREAIFVNVGIEGGEGMGGEGESVNLMKEKKILTARIEAFENPF